MINNADQGFQPDDTTPSLPAQAKAAILEIAEVGCHILKDYSSHAHYCRKLFIKLYPDQLQKSPAVEMFVQKVWSLIGANKLASISDDQVMY